MQEDFRRFNWYLSRWYEQYGRHSLPWRQTTDPYAILVSEMMLQQTQVERVIPKYHAFIAAFPTVTALAEATLPQVLALWQGLGYNRRAKFLQQTAQAVLQKHQGIFPATREQLEQLPGVGPYTAGAIMAFAYNEPVVLIETNVRAVFLYHFFPQQTDVTDALLLPLITSALDRTHSRQWYAALMDYGSHLKTAVVNPSRRSKHHVRQSKFIGSSRQVRGEIIRLLLQHQPQTTDELTMQLTGDAAFFDTALGQLSDEGLVRVAENQVFLGAG